MPLVRKNAIKRKGQRPPKPDSLPLHPLKDDYIDERGKPVRPQAVEKHHHLPFMPDNDYTDERGKRG
jgi:hypothetical protein